MVDQKRKVKQIMKMVKEDLTIYKKVNEEVERNKPFYREIYEKCGSYPAHQAVYSQIFYTSAMLRSVYEILNDESPISENYDELSLLRRDVQVYDRKIAEIHEIYFHDGNLLEKEVKEKILRIAKKSILRQSIKIMWPTLRRMVSRDLDSILE